MARRRSGIVVETDEVLDSLFESLSGGGLATRIRMLKVIKDNPSLSAREVADCLEVCDRTVGRWWSRYREGGVSELLEDDVDLRSDRALLTDMQSRRISGRECLEISPRLLRFINSLPIAYDVNEWTLCFRDALANVLDGVDRVTVAVDIASNLDNTTSQAGTVLVSKGATRKSARERSRAYATSLKGAPPRDVLYQQACLGGFPVEDYYKPTGFDFQSPAGDYIGSILLWSRRGRPTPRATLEFVESLRGFLTNQLTDCVLRCSHVEPELRQFKDIVCAVAKRIQLTPRQIEVFMLMMLGTKRDKIAARLSISKPTVAKHIVEIHRKAGTRKYAELFARYFLPLSDE